MLRKAFQHIASIGDEILGVNCIYWTVQRYILMIMPDKRIYTGFFTGKYFLYVYY